MSDWRTRAACLGQWNVMHPENDEREIAAAKQVCVGCPVARACFLDAVKTGDMQHGIRAGLRPGERRAVAKELKQRGNSNVQPFTPQPPKKPREPRPTSLAEALSRRTVDTGDGHVQLNGVGHVRFQGKSYTALQASFTVGHSREPEGIIRRTCGDPTCVRAEHLADGVIRDSAAMCGTRDGYRRHRKHGEDACQPCKQANTDADNRLRRTGTTKKVAA